MAAKRPKSSTNAPRRTSFAKISEPLEVPAFALIPRRLSWAGSAIGGIRETQEMLDFCAEKGILPETELISADQINEAYERVLSSDVRYRFVIDAATLA